MKLVSQDLGTFNGLTRGNTEIWYCKDLSAGYDKDYRVDPNNLWKTHDFIGKIGETDKNKIFISLQGENWSPNGEANELIENGGANHTSMSVGDIIRYPNGSVFVCRPMGWELINP